MWQRIVRIVPREVAWNGDFLGDWRCLWRVRGMHQSYFWLMVHNCWWKWFQTLSFLCVIICDLRWSKLWRFGRMLVQWGTKTRVTTLQHVQGVFVKYWPRQGVFLFGIGNPKYCPWVCSGLINKSRTIRNSFKVVDQTTFSFCHACYIFHFLLILPYR